MIQRPSTLLRLSLVSCLFLVGCDLGTVVDSPGGPDDAHTGDPAVAGLVMNTPKGMRLCSGVLVAPHVVLTAARCVENATEIVAGFGTAVTRGGTVDAFGGTVDAFAGGTVDAFGGTVDAFGGTVDAFTTPQASFIKATEWVMHPDFAGLPVQSLHEADLALVRLIADVTVLPVSLSDVPLGGGGALRAVGFGYADGQGQGHGVKHETALSMGTVDALSYEQSLASGSSLSMHGDVGGPTFLAIGGQEYVVGVHSSFVSDGSRAARDTRVDAHLSFIDSTLALWQ